MLRSLILPYKEVTVALKAKLTTQISVKMEPGLKAQLEAIADEEEVSIGSVIRDAITYSLALD